MTDPNFTVREGDPEHVAFHRLYDARGNTAELREAHPEYCSQCLYSAAAEWFYLGWHSKEKFKCGGCGHAASAGKYCSLRPEPDEREEQRLREYAKADLCPHGYKRCCGNKAADELHP